MPYSVTELRDIRDAAKAMINSTPCTGDFFASAELTLVKAIKACPDLMLHFGATKEESKADFLDGYEKGCADMVANWTEIKEACGDDTLDDYTQLAATIRNAIEAAEQRGYDKAMLDVFTVEDPPEAVAAVTGYERLAAVLQMAHDQAAVSKGKERHANDKPFEQQRMLSISHELGSPYGMAYQACKKISEGLQLGDFERTVAELLGAINYTAGIVVYLQDKQPTFMTLKPSTAEKWAQGSCASGQVNADGDVEPEQHHPV